MWNKLFPKTIENKYTGHVLGLILLGFYIFKSFFAGSIHMFAPDGGAQSIASIALDQFTSGGAESVLVPLAVLMLVLTLYRPKKKRK